MLRKILKAILAVISIPIVIGSTKAFLQGLEDIDIFNMNLYLLIGGFFAYAVFHIIFTKPMYIYAWGHEIVHVLATWLSGGKVISFSISPSGGSVTTTKTNLFIRLSPYFVPIHTIVLFSVFWSISRFHDLTYLNNEFTVMMGFTMSFHIFMTIEVMKMRQPDIVKTGYIFSVLIIYLANVTLMLLVLSIMFHDVSFVDYLRRTALVSKNIYTDVLSNLMK